MKAARVWIVLKAIFSYCMKYRPYMTAWTIVWLFAGIWTSISKQSIAGIVIALICIAIPIALKKALWLLNHALSPWNSRDAKAFGRAPRGRFTDFLTEYLNNYKE